MKIEAKKEYVLQGLMKFQQSLVKILRKQNLRVGQIHGRTT